MSNDKSNNAKRIADLLDAPGVGDIDFNPPQSNDLAQPADLGDADEVEDTWFAEVEQRIAQAAQGDTPLISAEQAIARARRTLA